MTSDEDVVIERHGVAVLACALDGPTITTVQDALDVIGSAFGRADTVAVPASRLDERFFTLRTGFAGEVMQKFVNYRMRLVIVGDISAHTATSSALAGLVSESNRGEHVWFVTDLSGLDARLSGSSADTPARPRR